MSINAKHIVPMSSRVISGGSADLETNGMLLTKNEKLKTAVAMTFSGADGVEKEFGIESEEAQFARQYFRGVNNQQIAPRKLVVGYFDNEKAKVTENMRAICNITRNWVGFTHLQKIEQEVVDELGKWADLEDDYCLFVWDDAKAVEDQKTVKTSLLGKLNDKFNCVAAVYGNWLDAAFYLAVGASIAWSRKNGMKVWFGKSAPGITPRVTSDDVAPVLDDNRINYYGDFATRNANFKLLHRGALASDHYGFIDVLYGQIWLKNAIQRACMDGFTSLNSVPYNNTGVTLILSWVSDPIEMCRRNGVISSDVELGANQIAQVIHETGDEQIVSDLRTKGYYVTVTFPGANGRAQREAPILTVYYTYAGSVQSLNIEIASII